MASPHQKNCVQCTQLIPLTAVHCVFCGATQPSKAASPDAMKTVMGMPAMRIPTPVPSKVGGAAAVPAAGPAAKPATPAVKPLPTGAGAPVAKKDTPPSAPSPAAGAQGFTPVARGPAMGPAAPIIASEEPQQHKPTLLGMTASDVEAHIASRASSGSSAYAVEQVEPANSLKKTIIGGIPSPVLPAGPAPIMGGAAAPGATVKKTVAMSAPVASKAEVKPAEPSKPAATASSAGAAAPAAPANAVPGIPDDAPTMLDSSADPANIIGAPQPLPLDSVEPSDSRSSTKSDMKVSEVDQRLKAAASGDKADRSDKTPEPEILEIEGAKDAKDKKDEKGAGQAKDAGAPKEAAQEAPEGAILKGAEAAADGIAQAKAAGKAPPKAPDKPPGERPAFTGTAIRIGAILFGLLMIGSFVMPLTAVDSVTFEWDALSGGVSFWTLTMFWVPVAGLAALVVAFLGLAPGGRGVALLVLGLVGIALRVALIAANTAFDGGAPLFLTAPWSVNGILLMVGLLLAPAGLFARAMDTGSMAGRILAAAGAAAILTSLLIPAGGDLPLLDIVGSFGDAPSVAIVSLLPAVLALASLAAFAPASTRAGTNVIGILFLVWGLASLTVVAAMTAIPTEDGELVLPRIDLDFLFFNLKTTLRSVGFWFLLSGGLGQALAGSPGREGRP